MGQKIQLQDKYGTLQYPVTSTTLVVDPNGKTVEERLQEMGQSGFKYFEERTVYPTKQVFGEDVFESEITDEQRAYNAETVAKALGNDGKGVIISFAGMLLQTVASESNDSYAEVLFSISLPYYTETVRETLKITSSGDATFEITIVSNNIDTSNLATKDELNNLTNEVIANEEVHAAALNDLNERKADKQFVEDALANIDTSGLATKEEVQNLTDEIIANEEVHAAALNDLNERLNDKVDEDFVNSAISSAITTALNTEV